MVAPLPVAPGIYVMASNRGSPILLHSRCMPAKRTVRNKTSRSTIAVTRRHKADRCGCQATRCRPSRCRSTTLDVDSDTATEAKLVSHQGDAYTVEGSIATELPPEVVWRVLTDYEGLADVFSSIRHTEILRQEPQFVLQQQCKWEFLVFSGSFRAELRVVEDEARGSLLFQLVHSSFMRHFEGRWQLRQRQGGGCLVEHRLTVIPVLNPPKAFSGYTRRIFVRQVARILEDLETELQRHLSLRARI